MPELSSKQATTHTLTLTEAELEALRRAAAQALGADGGSPHADIWRAFTRLGRPNTRSGASLTDTHTRPDLVGR